MDEGLAILDLCQSAGDLYEVHAAAEKWHLIEAICLNSIRKAGSPDIRWKKPFSVLAEFSSIKLGVPTVPNFEPLISELYNIFSVREEH